jgi:hypothetical protein
MQPSDAAAKQASSTIVGRRRPSASAMAPCQRVMIANGTM